MRKIESFFMQTRFKRFLAYFLLMTVTAVVGIGIFQGLLALALWLNAPMIVAILVIATGAFIFAWKVSK